MLEKDAALRDRLLGGPTVKLLASSKEFCMAVGNPSFDVFKLPDEHNELRAVLRDLCEKEIAPYAADVDEKARFPDEALDGAQRVRVLRGAHPRGVRRAGRRLGRGLHRDRGGRAGLCVVVADPGGATSWARWG